MSKCAGGLQCPISDTAVLMFLAGQLISSPALSAAVALLVTFCHTLTQ